MLKINIDKLISKILKPKTITALILIIFFTLICCSIYELMDIESTITIIVLILTLLHYLRKQSIDSFEKHFYQLLQIHRDNYHELQQANAKLQESDTKGNVENDYFKQLHNEIKELGNKTFSFVDNNRIWEARTPEEEKKKYIYQEETFVMLNRAERLTDSWKGHIYKVMIPYSLIYYSYTPSNGKTNSEAFTYLKRFLKDDVIDKLRDAVADKLGRKEMERVKLGKYFRHLYSMIRYVHDEQSLVLTNKEKNKYIKMVRAQLSDYEQLILFLNALCPFGFAWSFTGKVDFINRYDLIKNMPIDVANRHYGVNPSDIYPDIKFEFKS